MASRANPDYIAKMADIFNANGPTLFERLGELEVPIDVVAPTASVQRNAPLCEAQRLPLSCDRDRANAILNEDDTRDWLDDQMDELAGDPAPRLIDPNRGDVQRRDVLRRRTTAFVNFFDTNHLSATRSRALKGYFVASDQGDHVTLVTQRGSSSRTPLR